MSGGVDIKEKGAAWVNIICPILIGAGFYYLFCPDVWFVRKLDSVIGKGFHFSPETTPLLLLLRGYLCDFLWAYSLCGLVLLILTDKEQRSVGKMAVIASAVTLFGAVLECLQMGRIIGGTGDVFDVAAEALGTISLIFFEGRKL